MELEEDFILEIPTLQDFNKLDSLDLNKAPDTPGIYFIYDRHNCLLYIGKTIKLKTRLRQHNVTETDETRSPIPEGMMEYVKIHEFKEEELLFLEQFYIWKYNPLFNNTNQRLLGRIPIEEKLRLYKLHIYNKAVEERAKRLKEEDGEI